MRGHVILPCYEGSVIVRIYIEECRLSNGLVMRSDSRTPIHELYKEIYRVGVYTPPGFPGIKEHDVVIDLGANIGVFALYAANISPTVHVHAFEPAPQSFTLLKHNVQANKLSNIQCHQCSVSDVSGKNSLYVTNAGSTADTMIASRVPAQGVMTVNCVDCLSLDDLFDRYAITRCNFLKVDVEGSEFAIFGAVAQETLHRIDAISMEYHESHHSKGPQLASLLESRGFHVRMSANETPDRGMIYAARPLNA